MQINRFHRHTTCLSVYPNLISNCIRFQYDASNQSFSERQKMSDNFCAPMTVEKFQKSCNLTQGPQFLLFSAIYSTQNCCICTFCKYMLMHSLGCPDLSIILQINFYSENPIIYPFASSLCTKNQVGIRLKPVGIFIIC